MKAYSFAFLPTFWLHLLKCHLVVWQGRKLHLVQIRNSFQKYLLYCPTCIQLFQKTEQKSIENEKLWLKLSPLYLELRKRRLFLLVALQLFLKAHLLLLLENLIGLTPEYYRCYLCHRK